MYKGRDKTFFFISIEKYFLNQAPAQTQTVPTERMRSGDFGEILSKTSLEVDPLGRNIYKNAIYRRPCHGRLNGAVSLPKNSDRPFTHG